MRRILLILCVIAFVGNMFIYPKERVSAIIKDYKPIKTEEIKEDEKLDILNKEITLLLGADVKLDYIHEKKEKNSESIKDLIWMSLQ